MIKEKSFMDEITKIVTDDRRFYNADLFDYDPDISDGSSYDGFINYTDGFVDYKAEICPKLDNITFYAKDEPTKSRAEKAQLIFDTLCEPNFRDFYEWNIKSGQFDKFNDEFTDWGEFQDWYEKYIPYQLDGTPDLFDGKQHPMYPEYDNLYDTFNEIDSEEYTDTPAYIGITLKLYDEDNVRSNGKRMARLESYLNDDVGYGREYVGAWVRQMGMVSADGTDIGNHIIYLDEFEYSTKEDLIEKLKNKIQDAYASLGV